MTRSLKAIAAELFLSLGPAAAPPVVRVDDANAAAANRVALELATGPADLPAGTIYTDGPVTMTRANNGITMSGPATIASTRIPGGFLDRAALLVRCGADGFGATSSRGDETPDKRGLVLPAGQVGWHFDGRDSQSTGGVVARILPGQPIPPDLEFIRAFRGVPFSIGRTEFAVATGHGITVGEDLLATDGPVINEVIAEFRRVVAVTKATVTIDRPLLRSYRQGTFCRGQFPARQSYQGIKFQGQLGTVLLFQAADMQFSDCVVKKPADFAATDPNNRFSIMGCGRVELRRCDFTEIDGIGISHGHDLWIRDCRGRAVIGEQNQIAVTIERSRFAWLDAWQQCPNWTIRDSEFAGGPNVTLNVYDSWLVERVRVNGHVAVWGFSANLSDVKCNGQVHVRADPPARHAQSGRNVTLTNIEAEQIVLFPGTSGRLFNCSGPAICTDPATRANWTRDGKPLP